MTNRTTPSARHIILDTDIGTDVDDAMALAVILGSPQLQLDAVTTVYGDTALRARLAGRYAHLAGRTILTAAGQGDTLSGKEVWWPGHEGTLHSDLDQETIDGRDGVDLLAEILRTSDHEVELVAIGPLTNIALLIRRHPLVVDRIKHLWVMGGAFDDSRTEHNFRSDATAAAEVFAAGVPTRLFEVPIYPGPAGNITPSWDMTADAQKFLVTTLVGSNTSPPFTVVLNWETALKR